MKYRIKEITNGNSLHKYYVQYKYKWWPFWINYSPLRWFCNVLPYRKKWEFCSLQSAKNFIMVLEGRSNYGTNASKIVKVNYHEV